MFADYRMISVHHGAVHGAADRHCRRPHLLLTAACARRRLYHVAMTVDHGQTQLDALASAQFGLVTARQAHAAGIDDVEIAAAVNTGQWWPAAHDVWAINDPADKHEFEDWAVIWLSMDPDTSITDRRQRPESIISHEAAAVIRGLGTISAHQLTISTLKAPPGAKPLHTRIVHASPGAHDTDWTIVDGLPVATAARIIGDLAADPTVDGSHLGTVIDDALTNDILTRNDVADLIGPYVRRWSTSPAPDPDEVITLLTTASVDLTPR